MTPGAPGKSRADQTADPDVLEKLEEKEDWDAERE
jgi:hypothetical protein